MKNKFIFVLFFLAGLAVLGLGAFFGFRQLTNEVVGPVRAANSEMKTQVAQVLHPTPTIIPDPVTIVNEVRVLARLETIQYSVEKVVTAETGQEVLGELFGDRILLIAHGYVIAGVDLSNLTQDDIAISGGLVEINLPDPEIFVATLDNQKTRVYNRETGLFYQGDPELETLARQSAEQEIYRSALEDGILQKANDNAEIFLERLLDDLGFDDVIFTPYEPEALNTPTPLSTSSPSS
jgi:hypothetical protein